MQPKTKSVRIPVPESRDLPTIGPFRAIDVLGRGAMGVVYLAEQAAPIRRRVALKVVRVGMDSKEVIARFDRERQAMASLDHPNIAHVFDAGEMDDGRPYFALEYVPGLPITKFCDEHKMPNRQRLELFADVCDAVEYAHQRGLIHRDIKPSNVLVYGPEDRPIVKVIDFGIAKSVGPALYEDTFHTQTGQFVGTPAYMSPEQASFEPTEVDHRTDVYSLGVMLYELLVGVLPFDFKALVQKTLVQVQRFIVEKEPMTPSTRLARLGDEALTIAAHRRTDRTRLQREIRGDLDWLLMKALEKDRNRRYPTASQLAADVRHYLASEPITAGRPTLRYRAAKFIRRRRRVIAVSGLSAALMVAVGFGAVSMRSAGIARQELLAESTRREFSEVQLAANRDPKDAIRRLSSLTQANPRFLDARLLLAVLFWRDNQLDKGIATLDQVLRDAPETGAAHLLLAQLHRIHRPDVAALHLELGQNLLPNDLYYSALAVDPAEPQRAIALLDELLEADGANYDARFARAWRYFHAGDFQAMLGDANTLVAICSKCASAANLQGLALSRLRRFDESLEAFSRAIELDEDYAPTYLNRADLLRVMMRPVPALADCQSALKLEPDFAAGYALRASIHLRMGKIPAAQADCEQAMSLGPTALAYGVRGEIRRRGGEFAGALSDFDAAVERDTKSPDFRFLRAEVERELGDYQPAVADYSAALAGRMEVPEDAYSGRGLAFMRLGDLAAAMRDFDQAIVLRSDFPQFYDRRARLKRWMARYDDALADHNDAVRLAPDVAQPQVSRGITRWCNGDFEGAVSDLEAVVSRGGDHSDEAALHILWLWAMHTLRKDARAADAALGRSAQLVRELDTAHTVMFIAGHIGAQELLAAVPNETQRCGPFFYLGLRAYGLGLADEASTWFAKCREVCPKDNAEYDLALCLMPPVGPGS